MLTHVILGNEQSLSDQWQTNIIKGLYSDDVIKYVTMFSYLNRFITEKKTMKHMNQCSTALLVREPTYHHTLMTKIKIKKSKYGGMRASSIQYKGKRKLRKLCQENGYFRYIEIYPYTCILSNFNTVRTQKPRCKYMQQL